MSLREMSFICKEGIRSIPAKAGIPFGQVVLIGVFRFVCGFARIHGVGGKSASEHLLHRRGVVCPGCLEDQPGEYVCREFKRVIALFIGIVTPGIPAAYHGVISRHDIVSRRICENGVRDRCSVWILRDKRRQGVNGWPIEIDILGFKSKI